MQRFIRFIVVALLSASTPVLQAQEIGQANQGLALAEQICATCHAVKKGENLSPDADAPTFDAIAATPGMTATALSVALRTSHPTMPNLMLNADETANIVAYILSLKPGG